MKDFTQGCLLLIFAISYSITTFCYSVPAAMAGNKTKNQDRRTVRVTTGIEQVQGWEQGLVRANPNLARWHWDPIYSYKQGYATITPETAKPAVGRTGKPPVGAPFQPSYNYNIPAPQDNRPKHIPFSAKALEEVRARYAAPQNNFPLAQPIRKQSVFGQLSNKQTHATIIPSTIQPAISPVISSYGQPYIRQERTALQYNSQKTAVYGQLLNAKQNKVKSSLHQSGLKTKKQK